MTIQVGAVEPEIQTTMFSRVILSYKVVQLDNVSLNKLYHT